MKADIYNKQGKKLTTKVELNNAVFSIKPNQHSIYLAVKSELASKRQGTSSSKTRSEVRGGGAKPWKQKGTGRSRIGSTRNPSRVHGGAAFGPKPHKYNLKINKKERSLARKSALSLKISSNSFKILDNMDMKNIKTKDLVALLNNLKIGDEKITIIVGQKKENLYFSSRNVYNINLVYADNFSTYDIVNSNFLLFDKESIETLNNKL